MDYNSVEFSYAEMTVMSYKFVRVLFVSLCMISGFSASGYGQMINPYLPMNAVAAEPLTPYNLWDIPDCSRTSYLPCPTCGPFGAQVPDIPPVYERFPGPFNLPVPVP
jgi:hypothetical protein